MLYLLVDIRDGFDVIIYVHDNSNWCLLSTIFSLFQSNFGVRGPEHLKMKTWTTCAESTAYFGYDDSRGDQLYLYYGSTHPQTAILWQLSGVGPAI